MMKEPVGHMPCPKQEYEMRPGLTRAWEQLTWPWEQDQAEPGVGLDSVSTRNSRSCMRQDSGGPADST